MSRGLAIFTRLGLGLTVLTLGFVFYVLGLSAISEARAQERMYGQLREQLSQATTPFGGPIDSGTPIALIEAPVIGLRQVVVEGTSSTEMWAGPGHRRDTPLPGQPGASYIYGHSAAFGAPFRDIVWLQPNDVITVTTGQGIFEYHVTAVRRAKEPLPAPVEPGRSRLTLVTAEGDGWRFGWAPDHVVYVDAAMTGDTQLPPPGRPTTVAPAEIAMQGDPDAFIPLVLWLQLLAVAAIATIWARARWGGRQTYVVALPVVLAGVWGALTAMAQLLPNLS
jgi:sortase A